MSTDIKLLDEDEIKMIQYYVKDKKGTYNIIDNILYILSFDSYDSVINDNIIYAFSEIWIGISFLFSKNITKGYKNNKPYIYDPSDSLINNKKDIFIYEIIDTNNFIPIVNNEYIYKYYTYNQSYFNNKNIINNVYKYL